MCIRDSHNVYHYTWPKHEGLKVYPGIEITSSLGHINLLFTEKTPFAEHAIYEIEDEEALVRIIKEAKDYSLISVNHPCMPPWDFHAKSFPLDLITFMEVINDPTYMTCLLYTSKSGLTVIGIDTTINTEDVTPDGRASHITAGTMGENLYLSLIHI